MSNTENRPTIKTRHQDETTIWSNKMSPGQKKRECFETQLGNQSNFVQKSSRNNIQFLYRDIMDFKCDLCGYSTESEIDIQNHLKIAHKHFQGSDYYVN